MAIRIFEQALSPGGKDLSDLLKNGAGFRIGRA